MKDRGYAVWVTNHFNLNYVPLAPPTPGATGEFRSRATRINVCATPSEKCAPQARIVPQNKVTRVVPLEYISGPVPPSVSRMFVLGWKHDDEDLDDEDFNFATKAFLFLVFTPESMDIGQEPKSAPQDPVVPSQAKIVLPFRKMCPITRQPGLTHAA